jgi:hypothetical protein
MLMLASREPYDLIVASNEAVDLIRKRLECFPMFPLIARQSVNCGGPVGDMCMAKDYAHHMGRKSKIAE